MPPSENWDSPNLVTLCLDKRNSSLYSISWKTDAIDNKMSRMKEASYLPTKIFSSPIIGQQAVFFFYFFCF
jgi:hypothetical protein